MPSVVGQSGGVPVPAQAAKAGRNGNLHPALGALVLNAFEAWVAWLTLGRRGCCSVFRCLCLHLQTIAAAAHLRQEKVMDEDGDKLLVWRGVMGEKMASRAGWVLVVCLPTVLSCLASPARIKRKHRCKAERER